MKVKINWNKKLLDLFLSLMPKPKPSSLAQKFKEAREYIGIDHAEASKMMGIPEEEIKRFELGMKSNLED